MSSSNIIGIFGAVAAIGLAGAPAFAQGAAEPVSREVVQPLPPQAAADLSAALKRLGTNPNDGDALLKAGWASLELDDVTAAVGFFTRAESLPAVAGEAKAGLGAAQVYRKHPVEAIELFDEAEAHGVKLGAHAAERGLAYDLVGDNARAQQLYREALAGRPDDAITRRLALSQAIGGDQAGSEATLLPLLQHRDLAAYRTRAFALAALGKTDEAVAIAEAVMPASLASRISPYLRYMPKLTRAQQAAAGNFGHFPEADAIGKDDPRIVEYAASAKGAGLQVAAVDARLTPAGKPLGEARKEASAKPAAPPPATVVAVAKPDKQDKPAPPPSGAVVKLAKADEAAPAPAPAPAPAKTNTESEAPRPAISVATPPAAQAKPAEASPPPPPPPESLAEAFADFTLPAGAAAPAPGAVDVTAIEPPREVEKKPEPAAKPAAKPAKPPKPVHPSRIWVQVGTGRDKKALAFDWRRNNRESAKLFAGRKAYVVDWGRTNRMVTGPFASDKEAAAYVKTLKAAGIDAFTFTSKEGEVVEPLPGS